MQTPYVKQLRDKTKWARERLAPYVPRDGTDKSSEAVTETVASPQDLGYRTSTKLCLGEDEFGRRTVGLYERGTKTIVAVGDCPVHHPAVNQVVARLVGGRPSPPVPFYRHGKRTFQPGRLKFLTVRYCPETDACGVVLSHTGVPKDSLVAWAATVARPNISIYEAALTERDDDLILSDRASHLAGPPDLPFTVGTRTFRLTPLAFFQANFALTARFVEHVTAGIGGHTLLDLYGGFGAYGLGAAARFSRVHIVDANSHAIDAARRAVAESGLSGVTVACDSVESFLERRLTSGERAGVSHVIVNPPRGGLSSKALAVLAGARLPRLNGLTYVSCNLETLRRDLATLTRVGKFRLESVTPFDMFPQTDHLELVAKLTRTGARWHGSWKKPPSARPRRPRRDA